MTPEEIERRKEESKNSLTARHGGKIAAGVFLAGAALIGLSWWLFK